jgi:hypothetical protein
MAYPRRVHLALKKFRSNLPCRSSIGCNTLSATRNPERTESSLEQLGKYHDQLVCLEQKIPASEIQIPFKWKDAFDRGSIFGGRISLTVSSIAYEKVCILFNYAALATQIAESQVGTCFHEMQVAGTKVTGIIVYK